MRLINVDRVKDLLAELLMGVDGGTDASYLKTYEVIDRIEKIVNEWVDKEPTVEAIPIEWLKEWFNTKMNRTLLPRNFEMVCSWMIYDWEKEK